MMKVKDGYMLREVAGNSVVVAVGQASLDFNGLITLNGSGTMLWRMLETGVTEAALVAAVVDEYEVDPTRAQNDIEAFINKLKGANLLA